MSSVPAALLSDDSTPDSVPTLPRRRRRSFTALGVFGFLMIVLVIYSQWYKSTAKPADPMLRKLMDFDALGWFMVIVYTVVLVVAWWTVAKRLARDRKEALRMTEVCRGLFGRIKREKMSVQACELELLGKADIQNPSPPQRLVQRLRGDSQARTTESLTLLVAREADQSGALLHRFTVLQRVALHLGILGTFLHLLGAMGGEFFKGEEVNKAAFEVFFDTLATAFLTSVYGLSLWFITAFVAAMMRSRQRVYLEVIEDLCLGVQAVFVRAEKGDEDTIAKLDDVNRVVGGLATEIRNQSFTFASTMKEVAHQLNFMAPLSNTLNEIKNSLNTMDRHLRAADASAKIDVGEMQAFHREVHRLHAEMMKKANDESLATQLSETLRVTTRDFATAILGDLRSVDDSLKSVAKELKRRIASPNAPTIVVEPDLQSRAMLGIFGVGGLIILLMIVLAWNQSSQSDAINQLLQHLEKSTPAAQTKHQTSVNTTHPEMP